MGNAFLLAEESAQALLATVGRLKSEIEGYAQAKGSLSELSARLVPLTKELATAAAATTAVFGALKQVGTPEILAQTKILVTLNETLVKSVQGLQRTLSESLPALEHKLQRTVGENCESIKLSQTTAFQTIWETVKTINLQLDEACKNTSRINMELHSVSTSIGNQLARIEMMLWIGLPVMVIALSAVMYYLRAK